jgi:hypothetical protein
MQLTLRIERGADFVLDCVVGHAVEQRADDACVKVADAEPGVFAT